MKNELRAFLAIALCVGIWLFWSKFMMPQPAETAPPAQQESAKDKEAVSLPPPASDETAKAARADGKKIVLENDFVKITLDANGGVLTGWELKKFKRNGEAAQLPVVLAEQEGDILNLRLRQANFEIPAHVPFDIFKSTSQETALLWKKGGVALWKRFRLEPDSYQLKVEVELFNHGKETISFVPAIDWAKAPVEESPQRGAWIFKTPPDRWHPVYFKDGSIETVQDSNGIPSQNLPGNFKWAGAESRYFLGTVIPAGQGAANLEIGSFKSAQGAEMHFTRLLFPAVQVLPSEKWIQKLDVYGGPKELEYLKGVGGGMDKAIGYGWTSVLAVPILFLLQIFYKVVHNYGLAVILLTVLIKLLLNPINRKSLESMKRMQALQPKLKEIREKYPNNKERLNLEMMQLFKTHKVNPMGGCLPMLLQLPIYIALYKVLWNSVELYHAPFFWFYRDLSAPDPYFVMPILLGLTMVVQTKMTPNPSADPAQQKMMMIMPLMFAGFMIFLPMGLVLYILVNTLMTILQQWMYQKGIRFRDLLRGRLPAAKLTI